MSTNEMSSDLEQALDLLQQGDALAAEDRMTQAVVKAKETHGADSAQHAHASYELGSLLSVLGRSEEAAAALRVACSIDQPQDSAATRDRLTYMMQLGELLNQLGELDEAELVLREGLRLRAEFYGIEHSGYGFGLEPLARVLMDKNELKPALELAEQTIDVFWMNGHPRVSSAFPLRALILRKLGDERPGFDELDELDDEIWESMVDSALELASPDDAVNSQSVLYELFRKVENRLGEQHDATVKLLTGLANVSATIGPSEGRIEIIEKVVAAHLSKGNTREAIHAMLALAMAEGDVGNHDVCERTYRLACHKAKQLGDLSLQSQCLRNLGLFYSEQGRKPEAERALRLAAQSAKKADDRELLGRSIAALGIFFQHDHQPTEAKRYLARAVELLDPAHPDSVCCRSHLQALENGESCGCGDVSASLCEAFRQQVLRDVPPTLINNAQISLGENGFEVSLDFARDLTDEENELLNRKLQQIHVEFRKQIEGS